MTGEVHEELAAAAVEHVRDVSQRPAAAARRHPARRSPPPFTPAANPGRCHGRNDHRRGSTHDTRRKRNHLKTARASESNCARWTANSCALNGSKLSSARPASHRTSQSADTKTLRGPNRPASGTCEIARWTARETQQVMYSYCHSSPYINYRQSKLANHTDIQNRT